MGRMVLGEGNLGAAQHREMSLGGCSQLQSGGSIGPRSACVSLSALVASIAGDAPLVDPDGDA